MGLDATRWSVILPVKPFGVAKSRMLCEDADRADLARAMAFDVLDVLVGARTVRSILVVTADAEMTSRARSAGATVLQDRPFLWHDPLNQGVRQAARWLGNHRPDDGVAVVLSDLAALRVEVLDDVLAAAQAHDKGFVPNVRGSGSTILTARDGRFLTSAYGDGSALAHSRLGHRRLVGAPRGAMLDLDTLHDLRTSMPDLGVRTAAMARSLRRPAAPAAVRIA